MLRAFSTTTFAQTYASMATVITGTGAAIPGMVVPNKHFVNQLFYEKDGTPVPGSGEVIIRKFEQITGIRERKYAMPNEVCSNLGTRAAQEALERSGVDPETLDYIIVAHNFGDIQPGSTRVDVLPGIAPRIKNALGIKNPACVAYDLIFGCPGWVQGLIQAHAYILAGMAKKCLVVGSETLSRVVDPRDRDSMIFSDGAGAAVIEEREDGSSGVLATSAVSHCTEEAFYLFSGLSNKPDNDENIYIKMHGRKIYEYALTEVPLAMKNCLDKSGVALAELKKIFLHQANEKMDDAILERFYSLYGVDQAPANCMPMNIHEFGNSSVATIPTLLHLVLTGQLSHQRLEKGDVVLFASVGAGMHINAVAYRF